MKLKYQLLFIIAAGTFAFSVKHFRQVENQGEYKNQRMNATLVPNKSPPDRFYRLEGKLLRPEVVADFKMIQAKAFKSDSEKARMRLAINDQSYLLELGRYLQNVNSFSHSDFEDNQAGVITILVEALKKGNSKGAEVAMLEVILNEQVENGRLDLKIREILARSKAELLLQAREIKSSMLHNIETQLPGPVSQKIWQDVQKKPLENLAQPESDDSQLQEHFTATR